jgi:hypothetical protein
VCYETHVVGVYCAEGGKPVADDGEERDEHVVDYVDYVVVSPADVDPALWNVLACFWRVRKGTNRLGRGPRLARRA